MASIHRRTNGAGVPRWELMFRIGGRQKSRTFDSEAVALKWKAICEAVGPAEALAMLQHRDEAPRQIPTVLEAIRSHVESNPGITDGTRDGYLNEAARDIGPRLGALPMDGVTKDLVKAWVTWMAKTGGEKHQGLSPKTIHNRHALLSAVCKDAVERGWLTENPCRGIRLPKGTPKEMVILVPDEIGELVGEFDPRFAGLVVTLAGTGLRWSEATALQVRHATVDLRRGVASVRVVQAWKDVKRGPMVLGPPKSPRSYRTLTIRAGTPVFDAIAAAAQGRPADAWLFPSARGKQLRNSTMHEDYWQPVVKKLALPQDEGGKGWAKKPRIHDLRHTAATIMLGAGMDINAVSRILGHEKTSTTLDVYGHAMPGAHETAIDTLGAILGTALTLGVTTAPPG